MRAVFRYLRENPLGRRVLTAILLCSTCLALVATGVQLALDYRHDVSAIETRMGEIENSHLESIGASMWSMDDQQLRKQLEGLTNLPDVVFVQLRDPGGKELVANGKLHSARNVTRVMDITYVADPATKQSMPLGTLTVTASLDRIYSDLWNKAFVILAAQTTKTTLVAIFTLFIFGQLVSRHLSSLAAYARQLDLSHLGGTLALARTPPKRPDELDVVVSAINQMSRSIKHDFDELQEYRSGLEKLVESRTAELAQKVVEKEEFIQQLNREISDRERAERTVRENEERYRQLVEMSPDAILIERQGRIVFVNSGAVRMLGAAVPEQLLGRSLEEAIVGDGQAAAQEQMERLLHHEGDARPFEARVCRIDGEVLNVEVSRSLFHYAGEPAVQSVLHDITRFKHYEEKLRRQALHDALTGLPNRTLLMDRLDQAIARAKRQEEEIYVLFFDLDRFKYVNDTLGHDAGDELLKTITARMSACVRQCDTLARLGGDEFVVLLGEGINDEALQRLIQRVMASVAEPMVLQNQEVAVTCSIGLSTYPTDGHDARTLLKHADTAMYRAKEMGRNGMQRYDAEMLAAANDHLAMESRLRNALDRHEFLLHYQPLLDMRSGEIVGAEALIRWKHPELGMVPPARFIPLAEEMGLIGNIGRWVAQTACAQAQAWQRQGLPPLRMSINLSAQQLTRPEFEEEIGEALRHAGLAPRYLELEITESMSMNDPQRTAAMLQHFRAMGVGVAIDDFGTGYSNLAYLRKFPVTRLKLDRSFVRDIGSDMEDSALAKAIIGLAHGMNLSVLAEGVETVEQLAQLAAYGCDEMQGYYFSPPVPAEDFAEMLRSGRRIDADDLRAPADAPECEASIT